jgi:hypothetical protein
VSLPVRNARRITDFLQFATNAPRRFADSITKLEAWVTLRLRMSRGTATATELKIREKVSLSPVADKRVEGVVRRKQGAMYGFEFIGITPQIASQLVKLCEGLPEFQSLIDV